MAKSCKKMCAMFLCNNTTSKKYCDVHEQQQKERAWEKQVKTEPEKQKQTRERFYDSAHWKRLRQYMLNRFPSCAVEGCNKLATQVDHIVAISAGGSAYAQSNLQCLCLSCHSRKTAKEIAARKKDRQNYNNKLL